MRAFHKDGRLRFLLNPADEDLTGWSELTLPEGCDPASGVWKIAGGQIVRDDGPAWSALRAERDGLLDASDWTQMPDAPVGEQLSLAWKAYRQALRDLPENTTDPYDPDWPTAPASD